MVRLASKNDISDIANVHEKCFPDSFLSHVSKTGRWGKDILKRFYSTYLESVPELFFVGVNEENKVIGFCMGYYVDKSDQMKTFISSNKFNLVLASLLLLFKFDVFVWKKIKSRFNKNKNEIWETINDNYNDFGNEDMGDLLSVCVLNEFRGSGVANELVKSFLEALSSNHKKICVLYVETENIGARKFYEKNEFELFQKRGETGLSYIKKLF